MKPDRPPCAFCSSRPGTWYGYDLDMVKVYVCRRHRDRLQAACPQVIIFPIPYLKWHTRQGVKRAPERF